jgi:hypothetical protein
MSDTNELDRLRADLEVLKRYNEAGEGVLDRAVAIARDRIIRLDADPIWRFARDTVRFMERGSGVSAEYQIGVARYVRHLEAELESAKNCEIDENGHFVRDLSEAEADPWADVRRVANHWLHQPPTPDAVWVARLVLHLEADNAKQAARIAELEARPVPPLDPKRVIATACKIIAKGSGETTAAFLMQYYQAGDAGIYPLAGDELT